MRFEGTYILFFCLVLAGCFYTSEKFPEKPLTDATETAEAAVTTKADGEAQLNWIAPKVETKRYILRYGVNPENLDQEKSIPIDQIEKIEHPKYGLIYRFIVTELNPQERFFFSLQAENSFGMSPATPVSEEKVRVIRR